MPQKKAIITEPRVFADGETVLVKRPHLHSGNVGTVISFKDGMHRIRIPVKHEMAVEKFWHADVPGSLLEEFI